MSNLVPVSENVEGATVLTAPAPGLHRGLAYDEYARWDAVHHSILRHFNRTAAHAREAIVNPADQTEALFLGHSAHVAILEPARFEAEFVAAPKFDKRTNEGKRGWAAFQEEHAGQTCILQEEHETCLRMRDATWSHATAAELLKGPGLNEVSALWVDPETGRPCKARIDRLTTLAGWPVVVDLKTTRNAARSAFARDIHNFHYHQQGALYVDGLDVLAPHQRKFVFLAVEKERPYAVAVYELEEDALQLGRDEYRKHLAAYDECVRTNRWPAYGDGLDYVSLPTWAFRSTGD
jgi:hypothetical protein